MDFELGNTRLRDSTATSGGACRSDCARIVGTVRNAVRHRAEKDARRGVARLLGFNKKGGFTDIPQEAVNNFSEKLSGLAPRLSLWLVYQFR